MRQAFDAGASAKDLADQYHVNIRTIYRTLERTAHPYVEVRLGEFRATFVLMPDGPVQCGPWVPA